MIDTENQTLNYRRYHIRDICKTLRELSPERKQNLLNEIQLRKGCCNLMSWDYNHPDCEYIEALLNGKRPRLMLLERRNKWLKFPNT